MGTAGALTQIIITQNTDRLCINGNFPHAYVSELAKHVYSDFRSDRLLAELLGIPAQGVLHQCRMFHSEALKRLAFVLIHTCMSRDWYAPLVLTVDRNVPFLLQPPPPGFYFPFISFKFAPDSNLKSGFSVLNQTYGMLL